MNRKNFLFNVSNKRIFFALITLGLLIIEVLIALFVHDRFVRPYIGDVIVVAVVYCFVRIFIPRGDRFLPLWVFIFAAGVEVLQLFHIVDILGFKSRFMRILVGSVFDIKDIICYGIGCILIWIVQFKYEKEIVQESDR